MPVVVDKTIQGEPNSLNLKIMYINKLFTRKGVQLVMLLTIFSWSFTSHKLTVYEKFPITKENLWIEYSPQKTTFKLWSPPAEEVVVNLYKTSDESEKPYSTTNLKKGKDGLWKISVNGDLQKVFYTYNVKVAGKWLGETPGIYATAVGVNGKRAMVLDLSTTNPQNWNNDKGPELKKPTDAILYELHVRDITTHKNSGSKFPGKFLGLVEKGTTSTDGLATGIDHMKELGITHVHLLPSFDYRSVDESNLKEAKFNWGYDPQNYNVPEGSYATDPFKPEVRIAEFKQMVKGFHDNGIGVILDVVYNHTGLTEGSNFNLEVPGYYYRHKKDGSWSDASACGNETASERAMMRRYIIESCKFWVREYHLDGFRFDLMGIHDIETMNTLSQELRKIKPDILIYGEGWTAGESPLPDSLKALKANTHKLHHIAAFSDDIRDGLKGSVFEDESRGFVSGAGKEEAIKFGIVGSIHHPQVNPKLLDYSKTFWAKEPWQTISYVSCHDNHTLYDKLKISCKDVSESELQRMHKLANTVVLTSQGIPFLHAGVEMLRTKNGEHNSYNKPDEINQINWNWKTQHQDVFRYYQGLIALRKAHPAFSLGSAEKVNKHLEFLKVVDKNVVAFQLKNLQGIDTAKNIVVVLNGNKTASSVSVPDGAYTILVKDGKVDLSGISPLKGNSVQVAPQSAVVMVEY